MKAVGIDSGRFPSHDTAAQIGRCVSPAARDFSLLVQRKVTKRKHLPRDVNIAHGMWSAATILDSPSWLDPKTAGIRAGRPPGSRTALLMKILQSKAIAREDGS